MSLGWAFPSYPPSTWVRLSGLCVERDFVRSSTPLAMGHSEEDGASGPRGEVPSSKIDRSPGPGGEILTRPAPRPTLT